MEHVVINEGRQQIVAGANRVRVARQMQIDILHGDNLSPTTPRAAAFDAEDRSERWLTERDDGPPANSIEAHRESDRGRRLAFSERGRVDGCHQYVSAEWLLPETLERRKTDLAFVPPIGMQLVRRQSEPFGNFLDREGLIGSRDVEIGHGLS